MDAQAVQNGNFVEWNIGGTICKLPRRYTKIRVIGRGSQGIVV